jgi:hypothetical protein
MRSGGHVVEVLLRAVIHSGGCGRSIVRARYGPGQAMAPVLYQGRGWRSSGGGWWEWGTPPPSPCWPAGGGRYASLLRL